MQLTNFESIRPPFETSQSSTLDWFLEAHIEAEKKAGNPDLEAFKTSLKERLWRVGCKPGQIDKRGHILPDFLHQEWEKMEVYQLKESPSGRDLSVRSSYFSQAVDQIFETYYPEKEGAPDSLIHVSCTGYVSPSGAQKIVSKRDWGHLTTVTHAYHMGCYAAIPAIRIAMGFLEVEKKSSDIVHTEICSLHSNPSLHATDQLVSQSLFADGFIKYSLVKKAKGPHYQVLTSLEEILGGSLHAMSWNVSNWGFQMSLSKEVPVFISRNLKSYLTRLAKRANISLESLLEKAVFAIHPGGPKILSYIQELLNLKAAQIEPSYEILRLYGNMSSATLPHVWESVLKNRSIPDNTLLVSLAFGPGLTICGNLLQKRCGF